jgi:hypothetical protein
LMMSVKHTNPLFGLPSFKQFGVGFKEGKSLLSEVDSVLLKYPSKHLKLIVSV